MFFIGFLFGLEALPILLLILFIVLVIKFYGHIQHVILAIPWWAPLAVTLSLVLLYFLCSKLVSKESSLQDLLLGPLSYAVVHSLWIGYGEYFCARDVLLFTVVGLPGAIAVAIMISTVVLVNGWKYILEIIKTERMKYQGA